ALDVGDAAATPPSEELPEGSLIGVSLAMQRVRERLQRACLRDFSVLISGESGTGKETAARYVHAHSARRHGPFIPIHCTAIPAGSYESELFGHCRGAFKGADADRAGLIEAANGGTLFLDEVGDIPLSIQAELSQVLQAQTVCRLGEETPREVDIRIIAATSRDLGEAVRAGRFREDLFYSLNVVPVHMPPLRQRREDIPELLAYLLRQMSGSEESLRVTPACVERVSHLPLTGNVRELENLLQRMIALSDGRELNLSVLGELQGQSAAPAEISLQRMQQQGMNLDQWLEQSEVQLIEEALARSDGNITHAAEILGVSFRSLRYRLRKLDIREDQ
ncbi:MAG TPA: sigma-54 dependent transcriptional regulator, partial [Mariprofundaceae bacterium]|nr:sigma-54 dependent transcriptional regulator [Mariprofundaceae bacterium]